MVHRGLRASLHHLCLTSSEPERLARFYERALRLEVREAGQGWSGIGNDRVLLFRDGPANGLAFAAYQVDSEEELVGLRARMAAADWQEAAVTSEVFEPGAVGVRDPDGNCFIFGRPRAPLTGGRDDAPDMPARLQHVVLASRSAADIVRFFRDVIGFVVSDNVVDDEGEVRTSFLRSSDEHHSFAVFQASENRLDHQCYEAGEWGMIRAWADHMASERIRIEWGPGRHGPGNNLFLFIRDVDGNWIELSAELERVQPDRSTGTWPHEERTLNLWGAGLLRS